MGATMGTAKQSYVRGLGKDVDNLNLLSRTFPNNNLLLTEREGRTVEYWPEVMAIGTERSEVRTKSRYSLVRLEQATRSVEALRLPGKWGLL